MVLGKQARAKPQRKSVHGLVEGGYMQQGVVYVGEVVGCCARKVGGEQTSKLNDTN